MDIELVGICSAESMEDAPVGRRPKDILKNAESIVVLGIPYINAMLEKAQSRIWSFHYITMGRILDHAATVLARFIDKKDYDVVNIAAAPPFDTRALIGDFSHKHAAVKAGLGEFGKNNLVLTPKYGPRVMWVSLITNASSMPTKKEFEGPLCIENCVACIKACPVNALTGNKFDRETGAEHKKDVCWARLLQLWNRDTAYGIDRLCGLCIKHCPIGRK